MSALGQKATLQGDRHMSALPQKSEITDLDITDFMSTRPDYEAEYGAHCEAGRCRRPSYLSVLILMPRSSQNRSSRSKFVPLRQRQP
jgi:hypothetical protein